MEWTVRRALADEDRTVGDIFLAARARMPYLPRVHTDDDTREYFAELVATVDTWVGGTAGDEVRGFAIASEQCLEHLYVDPSAQRLGLGGALLDHVMAERPAGFTLWTFQENVGACHFYERAGLRVVRLTDGRDNEEHVPDVLDQWQPA